ncbi:MAG: DUF805 domain-containing protein [bacterium]|nr:DUF805 domain-containing protein [bacterium]
MSKMLSMEGRIGRSTYVWVSLGVTVASYAASFMIGLLLGMVGTGEDAAALVGGAVGLIATAIVAFAAVKRLHDLGRPGVHYWLFLIPLYNLYLGFVLLFQKGGEGPNQFGNDPCAS